LISEVFNVTARPETVSKYSLHAAYVSAVLAVFKTALFYSTGFFVAALSAWDSVLDVVVSFINSRVVKFARQSADWDHPYGHGKAESIAALGQSALILGGAVVIIVSGIQSLVKSIIEGNTHKETLFSPLQMGVFFFFCALGGLGISFYLKRASKRIKSVALRADAAHYSSDFLTNLASSIGFLLMHFFEYNWIDPVCAILFALWMSRSAIGLLRESIDELMDKVLEPKTMKQVLDLVHAYSPQVIDVHNFRGRKSGHKIFLDFHVTLPGLLTLNEVHELIDDMEKIISEKFDADVVIHADPK
jgi:ferrous-iron efflux pump FieF